MLTTPGLPISVFYLLSAQRPTPTLIIISLHSEECGAEAAFLKTNQLISLEKFRIKLTFALLMLRNKATHELLMLIYGLLENFGICILL